MISFRPAAPDDAPIAVAIARNGDPHEWTADRLERLVDTSVEAWAGLIDGEIGALFGLQDDSDGVLVRRAATWLMTTQALRERPVEFARLSRPVWSDLRQGWDIIHGACPASEGGAVLWLQALGFSVGPERAGWRRFEWRDD